MTFSKKSTSYKHWFIKRIRITLPSLEVLIYFILPSLFYIYKKVITLIYTIKFKSKV